VKQRILFLCIGNSCRSQMAEALLRHHAGDQFEAYSAGLEPKGIHPFAEKVMQEVGVSLAGQYSKEVGEYLGKTQFDYVITVCSNAEEKCPTFPGPSQRLHWAFDDPAAFEGTEEEKLGKFREVRDQIDERIRAWLAEQGASPDAHSVGDKR